MLQVNGSSSNGLKIKSIRKVVPVAAPTGSTCSLEPGDGTDKPPC